MSHHFDTPTAREDPRICVNDFYLFDGAAEHDRYGHDGERRCGIVRTGYIPR